MRLIIASNRLPVSVRYGKLVESDGGLATALLPVHKKRQAFWIGYLNDGVRYTRALEAEGYAPIHIDPETYHGYYDIYANRVLWPTLHNIKSPLHQHKAQASYHHYVAANKAFADAIAAQVLPDDLIWVHDYHLMLVPQMLRERGLTNKIGFFLHTPFAHIEYLDRVTERAELLEGLLGADVIGLQTAHLLPRLAQALETELGHEVKEEGGENFVRVGDRTVRLAAFPIGIDFEAFNLNPKALAGFYESIGETDGKKIIASLSRLDYTKGILQQLAAIRLLAADLNYTGKFVFKLTLIPSREDVPEYQHLRQAVKSQIAQINGEYAASGWQPISFEYGHLRTEALRQFYLEAGVLLVTPVADGMNLIAKEYLATNPSGHLILSHHAGAAHQLREALLVEPNDPEQILTALRLSLNRPVSQAANRRMRHILKRYNVFWWSDSFISSLGEL